MQFIDNKQFNLGRLEGFGISNAAEQRVYSNLGAINAHQKHLFPPSLVRAGTRLPVALISIGDAGYTISPVVPR